MQQVYTSWLEANKLTDSDKATNDWFGQPVTISGDGSIIVVGAWYKTLPGSYRAGPAYVFQGQ